MTLEEQAEAVVAGVKLIRAKLSEINKLAKLVLFYEEIDSDIFQFSQADKQKLIQHYTQAKTDLASLVADLP